MSMQLFHIDNVAGGYGNGPVVAREKPRMDHV